MTTLLIVITRLVRVTHATRKGLCLGLGCPDKPGNDRVGGGAGWWGNDHSSAVITRLDRVIHVTRAKACVWVWVARLNRAMTEWGWGVGQGQRVGAMTERGGAMAVGGVTA